MTSRRSKASKQTKRLYDALEALVDEIEGENRDHDDECITLCPIPEDEKCRIGHGCWCTNFNEARAALKGVA